MAYLLNDVNFHENNIRNLYFVHQWQIYWIFFPIDMYCKYGNTVMIFRDLIDILKPVKLILAENDLKNHVFVNNSKAY